MESVRRNNGRITIFLVNGLGDQLLALPAIRALRALFPENVQIILGQGLYPELFYECWDPCVYRTVWWKDRLSRVLDVQRTLEGAQPCDLFISLSTWVNDSIIELASGLGAKRTVGLFDQFDEKVSAPRFHMFDRLFSLPKHFDKTLLFGNFCYPPVLPPAALGRAIRFVSQDGIHECPTLFVHPETDSSKTWEWNNFRRVIQVLLAARPDLFGMVSSLHPLDLEGFDDRVVGLGTDYITTLSILKYCDFFLGIDSCFLHAADLFRVPGVALFGPTTPDEWGFHLCSESKSLTARNMESIHADKVLQMLLDVIDVPPKKGGVRERRNGLSTRV